MIDRALEIEGWMTPEELSWLAEQAKIHKRIAEVGSYMGRSTRALGDNTEGVVFAYDDWKGPREEWWVNQTPEDTRNALWEAFRKNLNDLIQAGRVIPCQGDHAACKPEQVDMVFIDGDHEYESVLRDIALWRPFLKEGGILAGHDLYLTGVKKAVEDGLGSYTNPAGTIWCAVAYD